MARRRITMLLAAACLCAAGGARAEIGLAARFGDVILEGAQPGRTYNLRQVVKLPFAIMNMGDAATEVVIEFLLPPKSALAENFEPIPDPTWFKSIPDRMAIAAHGMGYFDLLLTIPDDPKLKGHHYQAIIRARMAQGAGMLAVGIDNKIRISIGPGPATLQAEKKRKAMAQLDFDVKPQALYVSGVPVGKSFDVRKEQSKSIRVANYAADPLSLQFTPEGWSSELALPEGYAAIPDPKWVVFKSSMVTVAPEAIGQLGFHLEVPKDPKHKGKKYAVLIRSGLTSGFWLDAPVKLFIETQE